MSGESKVVFARDGALGTVTLQSPPLNLIGQELIDDLLAAIDQVETASGLRAHLAHGIPGADALLLDVAVGLFDTEDARGGIKAFLGSGAADSAFRGPVTRCWRAG